MANPAPTVRTDKAAVRVSVNSVYYRPKDYFGRHDIQTSVLTQVKGTVRRKALLDAVDAGEFNEVPDAVKGPALSEPVRQFLGSLQPASCFYGG